MITHHNNLYPTNQVILEGYTIILSGLYILSKRTKEIERCGIKLICIVSYTFDFVFQHFERFLLYIHEKSITSGSAKLFWIILFRFTFFLNISLLFLFLFELMMTYPFNSVEHTKNRAQHPHPHNMTSEHYCIFSHDLSISPLKI